MGIIVGKKRAADESAPENVSGKAPEMPVEAAESPSVGVAPHGLVDSKGNTAKPRRRGRRGK